MPEVAATEVDTPAVAATEVETSEVAASEAVATVLQVRIEPTGLAAERGVAALCAGGNATRDPAAELGSPAAVGTCSSGRAAVDLLVSAAALALDDTDLHITLQRT